MTEKEARIVYMGTPDISAFLLEEMITHGYNIVGVITRIDKPVGRKQILEPVPTKVIANKYNIPVFQPLKIRLDYEFVKELKPDIIITFSYGQIIPQGLLDIPPYGCLNLHGSLLPKYRGAAPMQYAIAMGEKETGVSLMEMVDKMDAGRVYAMKSFPISEDDTYKSVKEKMKVCARDILFENLDKYLKGNLIGKVQDEDKVTFAPSIKKEEEHLDLAKSSIDIINWIRALNDSPGVYAYINGQRIKLWKAKLFSNNVTSNVGTIVKADKQGLVFQARDGQVAILELQKEGKKSCDYKTFINGNKDLLNSVLN